MIKILICGGRDYRDKAVVYRALDYLQGERGITGIIQGAADGADRWAAEWGFDRGIPVGSFPADWSMGRKAGPLRNRRMIVEGKPDAVVAFPGREETANMVTQARAAGFKPWFPYGET